MRVENLEIKAFGCLENLEIEFGDGVALITGLNEAGKTTLQQAIVAALFGFYRSANLQGQRGQSQLKNRLNPWGTDRYALAAKLVPSKGKSLKIEWEFPDRTSFTMRDALTGVDLTADYRGGGENVLDQTSLCGVSREFFEQVCVISQGEIHPIEDGDTVSKTLEAMASTGGQDASGIACARALRE